MLPSHLLVNSLLTDLKEFCVKTDISSTALLAASKCNEANVPTNRSLQFSVKGIFKTSQGKCSSVVIKTTVVGNSLVTTSRDLFIVIGSSWTSRISGDTRSSGKYDFDSFKIF